MPSFIPDSLCTQQYLDRTTAVVLACNLWFATICGCATHEVVDSSLWGVARCWTRRFGRISLDDGYLSGCHSTEIDFDAFRART